MSRVEDTIDLVELRDRWMYHPDEGHFTAVKSKHARWPVGRVIGGKDAYHCPKGYIYVNVMGVSVAAHRLAWFYVHGRWPTEQVDHVNHIRDDNRIVNLRECTNAENRQNIRPEGYGSSGYLGVYERDNGRWMAKIIVNGKMTYLGLFDSAEDANAAYLQAKERVHIFASTGVSSLTELRA